MLLELDICWFSKMFLFFFFWIIVVCHVVAFGFFSVYVHQTNVYHTFLINILLNQLRSNKQEQAMKTMNWTNWINWTRLKRKRKKREREKHALKSQSPYLHGTSHAHQLILFCLSTKWKRTETFKWSTHTDQPKQKLECKD